jgi:hypothetical protein
MQMEARGVAQAAKFEASKGWPCIAAEQDRRHKDHEFIGECLPDDTCRKRWSRFDQDACYLDRGRELFKERLKVYASLTGNTKHFDAS